MKLENAPQDVAIQGDFETSDFNVGDIAFIVDMFADKVYTNKVRAVLRAGRAVAAGLAQPKRPQFGGICQRRNSGR